MSRLRDTRIQGGSAISIAAIFALVVIVCMAVLAVLTIATAHSSLVLSQRQAAATQELYSNELAAQTFLAQLDETLAQQKGASSAARNAAVAAKLPAICDAARTASGGAVTVDAYAYGSTVRADFTCENGRTLKVTLTLLPDGTYRIDAWRMTAIVNEEQSMGTLYLGD